MTECLQDVQLNEIISGRAAGGVVAEWTEHLDVCETCQQRLEQLSGAATWVLNSAVMPRSLTLEKLSSFYDLVMPADFDETLEVPLQDQDVQVLRPIEEPIQALLSPNAAADTIGNFGSYRVLTVLGRGGMGVVLQGIEPVLDRIVAIKVLAPHLAACERSRQRFLSEARAVAKIQHPHVVGIHQVAEQNGLPYIVMPFVDGESLDELIRRNGPLDFQTTIRIASQVCEALEAAEAAGIVHRDIKPENLLIERATGNVKVTDFGLARAVNDQSLTKTGCIVGTPQFMSPEQASGLPVDHRSDLYSLSAVMFTMLTGQPPFTGDDPLAIVHQVVYAATPSLSDNSGTEAVPAWLAALVHRTMSKLPHDRPQTAAILRRSLSQQSVELLPALLDTNREHRVDGRQIAVSHTDTMFRPEVLSVTVLSLAVVGLVLLAAKFGPGWMNYEFQPQPTSTDLPQSVETIAACTLKSADGTTALFDSLDGALPAASDNAVIYLNNSGPHLLRTPPPDVAVEICRRTEAERNTSVELGTVVIPDSWVVNRKLILTDICLELSALSSTNNLTAAQARDALLMVDQGTLTLTRCRLLNQGVCLALFGDSQTTIEDSVLASFSRTAAIDFGLKRNSKLIVRNSLLIGETAVSNNPVQSDSGGELLLRNSTIYADSCFALNAVSAARPAVQRSQALRIEARGNVFQARFLQVIDGLTLTAISILEDRSFVQLSDQVRWRGDDNLFSLSVGFVGFYLPRRGFVGGKRGARTLSGWRGFCDAEGESSAEAATGVLNVIKPPTELLPDDIRRENFAPAADHSAASFGARLTHW